MRSTYTCNSDLIVLSETWLNEAFFNAELFDPRYSVFRRDRNYLELDSQRGGGVLVAVSSELNASLILTSICNAYEDLWIQLDTAGTKLVIGCAYIPPNSTLETYHSFCNTCESLRNRFTSHKFLIYGDFNLPRVDWMLEDDVLVPTELNSAPAEILINTMCFLELQQINSVRNSLGRTLDLTFADEFNHLSVSLCPDPLLPIDDYHPVTVTNFNQCFKK